jgi:arsenate reductase (thioredoxin)
MAEAFAKHYTNEFIVFESAGIEPLDIHPLTIEAMKEVGIDISNNSSKKINLMNFTRSNCIVNIGNRIIERSNVVSLGKSFGIYSENWDIENPIPGEGKEADLSNFRIVRDAIEQEVLSLLDIFQVPIKKKK